MSSPSESVPRRGFPHAAAIAGLAMPLVVIGLSAAWGVSEKGLSPERVAGGRVMMGLLVMLCIAAGVVFATIALCNVGRYESRGLLGRGIIGLVFNGTFVVLFGLAFVGGLKRGVKARQTQRQTEQKKEHQTERPAEQQISRDARSLRNGDGDDSRMGTAWAAYLAEVEVASKRWQSMYKEMSAAKVLDFSEVSTKADLRSRQEVLNRYKATSDAMRALVVNSSEFYRKELRKAGASADTLEQSVRELEARNDSQRDLLLTIRDADTRISDRMIAVLSLLETNWGSWTCPTGTVVFHDSKTLHEYNRLMTEIRDASREQLAAQRKLASVR